MKIVPAILSEDFNEFLLRLRQAESFVDYVQIDLMDGFFVPSISFPADKLNIIQTSLSFEIHLMVQHPLAFMSQIDNSHIKKALFHFESDVKHIDFINQMKKRGIITGLAIKPETEIGEFRKIAQDVDTLMFLTVDPCCYGLPFKPEVLEKIEKAKHIFPGKTISADGGVSLENLKLFYDIGVDYVCVGSRIFLDDNPKENYTRFIEKLAKFGVRNKGNP